MQSRPDTVNDLQRALVHGGAEVFELVPTLLNKIFETRAWETRADQNGEVFKSFYEFARHRRWEGLGTNLEELLLYCKRPEFENVKMAILCEMPAAEPQTRGSDGRFLRTDNIRTDYGTSPSYTLRRLKRDRPDLAEKVVAREMSAHAAAIEAGFRKPPSPLKVIQSAWSRASDDERRAIRAWWAEQ